MNAPHAARRKHLIPPAVILAGGLLAGAASSRTGMRNPGALSDAAADTGCAASSVRDTGRAILCARVVDARTGVGVPGRGGVEFVRGDGESMSGPIHGDGTFRINVPAGRGKLTVDWSCRRSARLVAELTIPPGTGVERTFQVAVTPADTLCRRETRDRSEINPATVARWMHRGPCFALTLRERNPGREPPGTPSGWVRLDSVRQNPTGGRASLALGYEHDTGDRRPWAGWTPMQGDSLELGWSTHFSGLSVTLGVRGDSLAGEWMVSSDVILTDSLGFLDRSVYPNGPASARAVPCGSLRQGSGT